MRIIDHQSIRRKNERRFGLSRTTRMLSLFTLVVFLAYSAVIGVRYYQPLPVVKPVYKMVDYKPSVPGIRWPGYGQSAVGDIDSGVLLASGSQTPRPIASVAKAFTSLAVLRKHPLKTGEQGPQITITSADIASYNQFISKDGSVIKVELGEKISEYQAIQALMLPSANNMADTLTRWAFGSTKDYLAYAESLVSSLGLKNTRISDASGFDPATVSTAEDLVKIGQAAMKEPVFAEIVSQKTAELPVQGTVNNLNFLLGQNGVVGIKTGNTDEAGGCFLAAARKKLPDGSEKTFISAVMGANIRQTAVADSLPLIDQAAGSFKIIPLVAKGQMVGQYESPIGYKAAIIASADLSQLKWPGASVKIIISLSDLKLPAKKGSKVGVIKLEGSDKTVDAVLADDLNLPPSTWKLKRATQF